MIPKRRNLISLIFIVNCISKCSLKNLIFTWRNLSLLVINYLLIIRLQRKFLFLAFNYNVYSI